jgi:NADPH-dependent 7-cyano-7-deazaguanine reductase QueF
MKPADYTEDDTLPLLVDAGAPALVTVTMPAFHMCPFKDEEDEGDLTVTWHAGAQTVEIHSFAAWLHSLDQWRVSHEAFTYHVRETLESVGVRVEAVTTRWDTGGATVEVRA